MKVFVIPSWYPSRRNPNNGSFFREQALALMDDTHEITVLVGNFTNKKGYLDPENYHLLKTNDQGMDTYQYVTPNLMLSKSTAIGLARASRNMEKVFKRAVEEHGVPDVIHAHSFFTGGFVALQMGRKYHVPVVVTEHNSRVLNRQLSPSRIACLTRVVRESDRFLCVSKALQQTVQEITGVQGKALVTYNMVGDQFYYTQPRKTDGSFRFIAVGNLVESKKNDLLVAAFCKAFSADAPVVLTIAGSGPQRQPLLDIIEKNGRAKQIVLAGQLEREKVADAMRESDAFVLASACETFGVVYIEAMACGLPVVTVKNGGSNDLIAPSDGLLLDTLSVDSFAAAMRKMVKDRDAYRSEEISRSCLERFGKAAYRRDHYRLYQECIHEKE